MLAQSGEADEIISGRGLTFERTPDPPAPPPPEPFFIPRPDWDEEAREREAAERERQRQERDEIVREELARLADDAEEPERLPARRRQWRQEP